jgi:oxygen-independent coproporphyrinogen-3 oxidase
LVTGRDDLVDSYLDALETEVKQAAGRSLELGWTGEIETVFLGGGTPTYLHGAQLERLLTIVTTAFPISSEAEFSTEANPLDCETSRLKLLKQYGVNRVSLGGQSFQSAKLRMLERDHSPKELHTALEITCSHFSEVSLDLIFASPGETVRQWKADLQGAIQYPITHASTYGLTIERGSAFYGRMQKGLLNEVDDDRQADMYEAAITLLSDQGFEHYEISSFARPSHRCKHNQVYWSGLPWHAFGPGAADFLPTGELEDRQLPLMQRSVNHRSTTSYIRRLLDGRSPIAECDLVTPEQQLRERLVFGLRQIDGVDLGELTRWWGSPAEAVFEPYLQRYVDAGMLCRFGSRIKLTPAGLLISDSLWPKLLR